MAIMKVELDATVVGEASLTIDGEDMAPKVSRCVVDVRPNEIPQVILEGLGLGRITVNGVVLEHLDQRQAAVEFLLNVDPSKLEQEALESMGLNADGPQTTGEAILATLINWAGGNHPDRT